MKLSKSPLTGFVENCAWHNDGRGFLSKNKGNEIMQKSLFTSLAGSGCRLDCVDTNAFIAAGATSARKATISCSNIRKS